jgi:hypothetical protein
MDAWIWIVVVVVAVAVILWLAWRRAQRQRVSSRYGTEYERAVAESGGERKAVSELRAREKRREELDIRPLPSAARERHLQSWGATQARFVDTPVEAVKEADLLVQEVMRARGYPVEDFEQRAADISVDHPRLVDDYRKAHAISIASSQERATTEDLRGAMVHYRALFEELLGPGGESADERRPSA